MRDRDYYPAGAYNDPNAPYNQVDVPEKEFEITCSQSLSTTVSIFTSNYVYTRDCDEEGCYESYDTSDTCWEDEYRNSGYHTPLQLLHLFKEFLEQQKGNGIIFKTPRFTDKLIEECESWTEDEIEYTE